MGQAESEVDLILMDRINGLGTRLRNYDSLQASIMQNLDSHVNRTMGSRPRRAGGGLQVMSLVGDMEEVSERLDEQSEALKALLEGNRQSRANVEQVLNRPSTAGSANEASNRPGFASQLSTRMFQGASRPITVAVSSLCPGDVRLEQLTMGVNSEADCCSICLEHMLQGQQIGRITSCSHQYHWTCIRKWVIRQGGEAAAKCPLCKCSIGSGSTLQKTSSTSSTTPTSSTTAATITATTSRPVSRSMVGTRARPVTAADSWVELYSGGHQARFLRNTVDTPRVSGAPGIVQSRSRAQRTTMRGSTRYFPGSTLSERV